MSATLTPDEQAQALQTIEMFEVIAQSDPSDIVSLEILKEAYFKLGRHQDVRESSKRIAEAHVRSGQISSSILEYESVLQLYPNDPEILQALADIETRAKHIPPPAPPAESKETVPARPGQADGPPARTDADDGRRVMFKLFVEGKHLSEADFNLHWPSPNPKEVPKQVIEPFIQTLADKQLVSLDVSLKLITERSRLCFLPLEKYDVDIELARSFPRDVCLRWSILAFDRMSKSVMVATANPFNERANQELERFNAQTSTAKRFLWYLASPAELSKIIRKVFRQF